MGERVGGDRRKEEWRREEVGGVGEGEGGVRRSRDKE